MECRRGGNIPVLDQPCAVHTEVSKIWHLRCNVQRHSAHFCSVLHSVCVVYCGLCPGILRLVYEPGKIE